MADIFVDVPCRTCRVRIGFTCTCPERKLDRRIAALCEEKGYRFKPWEPLPHDAQVTTDGPPPSPMTPGQVERWLLAQQLRQQLIAELEERDREPTRKRNRGGSRRSHRS